jgi:5-formyltetrahydrofolate cyclo-ligase
VTPSQQKAILRQQFKQRLAAITPDQRRADSRLICERICARPAWQSARTILFFAPLPDEPDLWPLLEETLKTGRGAALPSYLADKDLYEAALIADAHKDLKPGRYGILEPGPDCPRIPILNLDIILVPGVAFSRDGYRLGRGRGYYDRLLAHARCCKWGVAFDCQLTKHLPVEARDIQLDGIATPRQWLEIPAAGAGGK